VICLSYGYADVWAGRGAAAIRPARIFLQFSEWAECFAANAWVHDSGAVFDREQRDGGPAYADFAARGMGADRGELGDVHPQSAAVAGDPAVVESGVGAI